MKVFGKLENKYSKISTEKWSNHRKFYNVYGCIRFFSLPQLCSLGSDLSHRFLFLLLIIPFNIERAYAFPRMHTVHSSSYTVAQVFFSLNGRRGREGQSTSGREREKVYISSKCDCWSWKYYSFTQTKKKLEFFEQTVSHFKTEYIFSMI